MFTSNPESQRHVLVIAMESTRSSATCEQPLGRMRLVWCATLLLCLATVVHAENWPQWRGPNQDGVVLSKGYPTSWSEDTGTVWKVKLPGWGTSTPAIWEDHIFVTGEEDSKNVLICLDRKGQKQWQVAFGPSAGNRNSKASGANPSPITDGTYVYVYFRSGDLACVDFVGHVVWQMNVQETHGPDRLNWDLGTSPVLTTNNVVIAVMHQGPSYLLALDRRTGEQVWKQERDLGAPAESRDSYTTPLVLDEGGQEALVVLGADHVTANNADTGAEIWRFGGLNPEGRRNFRQIASPVATEEFIIAPYARGETLVAIRRGGKGDITATHQAWIVYNLAGDVPTPVAHDGNLYLCGDRGDVACLEVATGKELWKERLPRNRYPYSASPILAGGNLYLTREDGTTFVLRVGDTSELIATNVLRENTYATPAFVDGRVILRTSDYLFCIGD